MKDIAIEVRILLRLEDVLENPELGDFLGLEVVRIVENFAVAVAEDVRRVPAADAELAGLEGRREDGLDERLAGLEVLAADRCGVALDRKSVV